MEVNDAEVIRLYVMLSCWHAPASPEMSIPHVRRSWTISISLPDHESIEINSESTTGFGLKS